MWQILYLGQGVSILYLCSDIRAPEGQGRAPESTGDRRKEQADGESTSPGILLPLKESERLLYM